ncbi:ras GEF [Neoconidiobolus thromboides FSU 785]|nr:ras GEF [Neoconidiobolus thromboides FSU 785]
MAQIVKALCDHISEDTSLLTFRQGDIFQVTSHEESGWWEGKMDDRTGLFPPQYVMGLTIEEEREYHDKVNELKFSETTMNKRNGPGSILNERKSSNVSFNDEESILPPKSFLSSHMEEEEDMSFQLDEGLEFLALHPTESWRLQIFQTLYNEIIPRQYIELPDPTKLLPPYWGVTSDMSGKQYYFNFINDIISWEFPCQDSNARILPKPISRIASSRNSSISESSDASDDSDTIADPLFDPQPRRARRPSGFVSSLDADSSELSWASVTSSIVLSVHRLNHSIKNKLKWDYVYHTNCIVKSIQKLLASAGITEQDYSILNSHALLKAHHSHLLKTLGKLVLASRMASSIWPSPDALNNLQSLSNDILLTVRHFVTTAQENGIRVKPQEDSEAPDSTSEEVTDLFEKLGEIVLKISTDVLYLNNARNEDLEDSLKLAKCIKRIILHTGEFLVPVSTLNFSDSPEKMVVNFNGYLQSLYEQTGLLTVTAQGASRLKNIEARLEKIRKATAELECLTYKILIGAKFLQEERDQYEYLQLKKEVDRIETSLNNDSGSKSIEMLLKFRPRRAISMSFYNINGLTNGIIRPDQFNGMGEYKPMIPLERGQRSMSSPSPNIRSAQSMETFPRLMYPNGNVENLTPNSRTQNHTTRHSISHSVKSNNSNDGAEGSIMYSDMGAMSPTRARSIRHMEKPWFLEHTYQDDSIIIVDNVVKGGTVVSLVERLTSHDTLDTSFIATFLLTYRSFTTTVEFFDLLFRRFNLQCPNGLQPDEQELWSEKKLTPVRLRVFNIMKIWLETYYNEGEDQVGLENLRQFACTTMNEVMPKPASLIVQLISKRRESSDVALRKMILNARTAPPPILPKNMNKLKLLDLDPLEIARQLTIIDSNNYNKIKPTEFLNKAWSRKDANGYVKIMTDMSNKVTRWVADAVLMRKDVKKRTMVIKHFINVMDKAFQLNNYNTMMAIIAGFTVAPVFRLKRTWDLVPVKTVHLFEHYKALMDTSRNFAKYRELLHSVDPPCVPFLGLYLTDLTFNDDGNPDYLPSAPHLINFSKQAKTAETIREIQQFQNSPYSLDSVAEIQEYILKSIEETSDMTVLYDISLKLEPRERDDEKIARLLHESGFL